MKLKQHTNFSKLQIQCWLFDHDFVQTKSETTEPDGVIKVTFHCSRCNEENIVYYPNLPIPPSRVIVVESGNDIKNLIDISKKLIEVYDNWYEKKDPLEMESWGLLISMMRIMPELKKIIEQIDKHNEEEKNPV